MEPEIISDSLKRSTNIITNYEITLLFVLTM